MYTGQAIKRMMYGNKQIRPKGITITVDHTKVASDLTDFVMTVDPTDLGATTLGEAQSIRVFKADGVTELCRDIITLNKMKIKTDLSSSTDTILKVVMDGVSPDYGVTTTYGRNNVYSTMEAVYDFASGNSNDRTGNGYDGTDTSMSYSGGYAIFSGSGGYITIPRMVQDDFTVCFLMNTTTNGPVGTDRYQGYGLVDAEVPGMKNDRGISLLNDKIGFGIRDYGSTIQNTSSVVSVGDILIHGTRKKSSGRYEIYANGSLENNKTGTTNSLTDPPQILIGNVNNATNYFVGKMSMVYLTTTVLSADRTSTEHNNISSPSTFYTVTL